MALPPSSADDPAAIDPTSSGLVVSVAPTGRSVMEEPISIVLSLRNRSATPVTVQSVRIRAISPLTRAYPSDCAIEGLKGFSIATGELVSLSCDLVPANDVYGFWINRDTNFNILVETKVASQATSIHTVVPIKVGRPEAHVIFGAAGGVLLLTLFLALRSELSKPTSAVQMRLAWDQVPLPKRRALVWGCLYWVKRIFVGFAGGAITAILILVLANGTKGLAAPIIITIDDFWGGLAVGIFSIPISRWLAKRVENAGPGFEQKVN